MHYAVLVPMPIEAAIAWLRAVTRLLTEDPSLSDELVEDTLHALLKSDVPVNVEAVRPEALYLILRRTVQRLCPSSSDSRGGPQSPAPRCLRLADREARVLHNAAGLSPEIIARMLGEPEAFVLNSLQGAQASICRQPCPFSPADTLAA